MAGFESHIPIRRKNGLSTTHAYVDTIRSGVRCEFHPNDYSPVTVLLFARKMSRGDSSHMNRYVQQYTGRYIHVELTFTCEHIRTHERVTWTFQTQSGVAVTPIRDKVHMPPTWISVDMGTFMDSTCIDRGWVNAIESVGMPFNENVLRMHAISRYLPCLWYRNNTQSDSHVLYDDTSCSELVVRTFAHWTPFSNTNARYSSPTQTFRITTDVYGVPNVLERYT